MIPVQLTLLSSILGQDFAVALERQSAVGIRFLDLKDGLWGKAIEQLDTGESARAAELIGRHAMRVHCFSTAIGCIPLEPGFREAAFRARYEPAVENALRVARVLRPRVIRLLAPRLAPSPGETAVTRMLRAFPWVMPVYRDWVDRIAAAGFGILIENEIQNCVLGSVTDVQMFFAALDRSDARYTWDIQNLWQSGTIPSLEVYRQLKPLIGAIHLKGGRAGGDGKKLEWAAPLDEASWPVLDIVQAVLDDGVVTHICLNPSHGQKPPEWNAWEVARREVAFLRRHFPRIA